IILGSGSEIHLCLSAAELLQKDGLRVRVVNMPSFELFDRQPESYRDAVLPPDVTARLAVEAAHPMSWYKYVGLRGAFQCMESYGGSAPFEQLYKHFGFTVENIAAKAKKLARK
ncbi:MAG: transketolase C-terminal domain-containing protein, partial [Planctomycetota bacterium]